MRILIPLVLASLFVPAAPDSGGLASADPWEPLRRLEGKWEGTSDGKFGSAELERTYEFVLNGKFLQSRTRSVAEREVHEDLGMVSWDQAAERFVVREFHSEGYVNEYAVEVAEDGTLVLETTSVENGFAPGLRAQSTLRFVSDDEIRETFALATGDAPFEACVQMELQRAAD